MLTIRGQTRFGGTVSLRAEEVQVEHDCLIAGSNRILRDNSGWVIADQHVVHLEVEGPLTITLQLGPDVRQDLGAFLFVAVDGPILSTDGQMSAKLFDARAQWHIGDQGQWADSFVLRPVEATEPN